MTRLLAENAWVEFHVSLPPGSTGQSSETGGQIDSARGVVTALRDISFDLKEGDRLGLMGHNGAGKSTMLRMLAGAYPPTRGRVASQGSISTLFNSMPGLTTDGTGRENIITSALHLGLSRNEVRDKIDEIADFAELGEFLDLPVRTYSSGMLTRLGFSIATAIRPEILLLDEGLATGDARFGRKAQQKMDELVASSSILVIASHSEALLARMCTRCILLEHGRIIADGEPNTVFDHYKNSVVQAAEQGDKESMERAYKLVTEMMKSGTTPSADIEELGLRHALTIAPDDVRMWRRYVQLLKNRNAEISVEIIVSATMAEIKADPTRTDLIQSLHDHHSRSLDELPEALKVQVVEFIEALDKEISS